MAGKVVKSRKAAWANVRALIQEVESLDLSVSQNMARARMIVLELFTTAIIAGDHTAIQWIIENSVDEDDI